MEANTSMPASLIFPCNRPARGGVDGLPKLQIIENILSCSVASKKCLLPSNDESVSVTGWKAAHPKLYQVCRALFLLRSSTSLTKKHGMLFSDLLCPSFVIRVKQWKLDLSSYFTTFDWQIEFSWKKHLEFPTFECAAQYNRQLILLWGLHTTLEP